MTHASSLHTTSAGMQVVALKQVLAGVQLTPMHSRSIGTASSTDCPGR
ncbi:MAG TPA: hypothetical protein VFS43_34515 [Polyangiaceae bacterium]|nr:hypothetical protein [Polyangiaceae bacterium]